MGQACMHGIKQHLGQSGDAGIDGIIRQYALRCPRCISKPNVTMTRITIGSSKIRNFIGVLDAKGATNGVFITTSRFAPAAEQTAQNYRHGPLVLIDGIKLTKLMLSYKVVVQKQRLFPLYQIYEAFFDNNAF
ncbi:restriction endonuclease [Dermabacteraceae bacterium P13101]